MPEKNKLEVIIMDLEGTLSDSRTRGHWTPDMAHEWHLNFAKDPVCKEVNLLLISLKLPYIIITAKPICYVDIVRTWLKKHKIRPALDIFMRPQGNLMRTPDVKQQLLNDALKQYSPTLSIDDREDNCAMFQRNNIPTLKIKMPLIPQTRCLPPEEKKNGRN